MVLRCAWGTCNADERYPDRLKGCRFIRFPTPKGDLEKCKRWIKACGRPHEQLNVSRINQHKAVCSKHFVGESGPTKDYPDPISADGSVCTPTRKPPKKRIMSPTTDQNNNRVRGILTENSTIMNSMAETTADKGTATQTEEHWVCLIEMLAMTVENEVLKSTVKEQTSEIQRLKLEVSEKDKEISHLKRTLDMPKTFGVELVTEREKRLKNLFKYYTGLTYLRFCALLAFLVGDGDQLKYNCGRTDLKNVSNENALFLTICRLRHGFGLKDLATRFGLMLQSSGELFNVWLDHIYFKLGQLSIWPHRDAVIHNMPKEYRREFPTSIIIIDGTEVRTQTPSALVLQSQLYSDYKSSTTLKGLIGCDPNGNVMFISELYTGSISDKALTEQSGFYEAIKQLKSHGFIKDGDAIMVDKGFSIKQEIEDLGLI